MSWNVAQNKLPYFIRAILNEPSLVYQGLDVMWRLTRGRYRLQPPWTESLCLGPWAGRAGSLGPFPERCWSSSRRQTSPPLKRAHTHTHAIIIKCSHRTWPQTVSHVSRLPGLGLLLAGTRYLLLLLSKSFHRTRERVLGAFTWLLRCSSDGQDAFFSVEDCPERFGYFAALQLVDYLEETTANTQITNPCLKSYKKLTVLAK